jgi:hypothetical protein
MTWGDALENINYWAALVAALATMVVGSVWYAKGVFGKDWMKLVGLKDKDLESKDGMAVTFTAMIVFYFITAVALSGLLYLTDMQSGGNGLILGAITGFAFNFGPTAVGNAFSRRKVELTLLDGGHVLLQFMLMGWIVGLWV